jgi:hypothetical protein
MNLKAPISHSPYFIAVWTWKVGGVLREIGYLPGKGSVVCNLQIISVWANSKSRKE